eukprot:gene7496-biopygen19566
MAVTELLWAQEDVAEERDRAPVGPGGCCRGACHGRDRAPLAQGDVVGDRVMAVTELLWTPGGCRLSLRLERGRAGLADLLPPPTQPQRKNSTTSTLALDVVRTSDWASSRVTVEGNWENAAPQAPP